MSPAWSSTADGSIESWKLPEIHVNQLTVFTLLMRNYQKQHNTIDFVHFVNDFVLKPCKTIDSVLTFHDFGYYGAGAEDP